MAEHNGCSHNATPLGVVGSLGPETLSAPSVCAETRPSGESSLKLPAVIEFGRLHGEAQDPLAFHATRWGTLSDQREPRGQAAAEPPVVGITGDLPKVQDEDVGGRPLRRADCPSRASCDNPLGANHVQAFSRPYLYADRDPCIRTAPPFNRGPALRHQPTTGVRIRRNCPGNRRLYL